MTQNVTPPPEKISEGLEIEDVMRILPHRFPMLLVDRVTELIPGECACGVKAVTYNEPFFVGHLPDNPIMPGVYIIEALMQLINIVVISKKNVDVFYSKITKSVFYRKVKPGCLLNLTARKKAEMDNLIICKVTADIENEVVFDGEITALIETK